MTKWWVPCQGSELGLSLLCHPAFKNYCPPLDIHSHAMNSVCFLPLGITHFCPPPLPNSPLCCSHVCSRCACVIYLVPSQKCHFFPHFRSHCCHCFGSCLSEESLVPGKHTSFSLADVLLHTSHFIFLPGWNQNPWWCQLSSTRSTLPCTTENNWNGECGLIKHSVTLVLFSDSCRNLQAHPDFCHVAHSQPEDIRLTVL